MITELKELATWLEGSMFDEYRHKSVAIRSALAMIKTLQANNFSLAAGQCVVSNGLLGDEHGKYCDMQRKVSKLQAENAELRAKLEPLNVTMLSGELAHTKEMLKIANGRIDDLRAKIGVLLGLSCHKDEEHEFRKGFAFAISKASEIFKG